MTTQVSRRRKATPMDWTRRRKRMAVIDRLFGVGCGDSLNDRLRMRWTLAAKFKGAA